MNVLLCMILLFFGIVFTIAVPPVGIVMIALALFFLLARPAVNNTLGGYVSDRESIARRDAWEKREREAGR